MRGRAVGLRDGATLLQRGLRRRHDGVPMLPGRRALRPDALLRPRQRRLLRRLPPASRRRHVRRGSIVAADYDQSCTTDADCVAAYQGPLCDECFCANTAINESAVTAYDAALAAGSPSPCNCPLSPPPVCDAGTCTLQ